MLTDIFANRYNGVEYWKSFNERDRRFLVQGFRIISEQIFQYYRHDGKEDIASKKTWETLNKKLSMELGLKDLSEPYFGYYHTMNGNKNWVSHKKAIHTLCENFVLAEYDAKVSPDRFIKERISFIELAFREKENLIAVQNSKLEVEVLKAIEAANRPVRGIRLPGNRENYLRSNNRDMNEKFQSQCKELNARFVQAGYPFHYHNGYVQKSEDVKFAQEVEQPFWTALADPKWKNVDTDMKEAFDLRDNQGRDPAWYAAKALESSIKIISDDKNWTNGREKGAQNYVDNLASKKNGKFINQWEKESLQLFFRNVRNPLGHGAGSADMPKLTENQTNWAIRFCMNWISTLIKRA